jgi:anti-sigma factor RsiW
MTPRSARPDENELHAYVDGRLAADRCAEIDAWLADDDTLAVAVKHYRAQNDALHALYDPLLQRTLPHGLDELALRRRIENRVRGGALARFGRVAAVLALMAASAAGGWFARPAPEPAPEPQALSLAEAGVSAHRVYEVEVRHAVEVPVGEEEHLRRWLSKRLDAPLNIPDLSASGYKLMGGRLLPAGGLPAAHFLYENQTGERLTLYIQPNHGGEETAFRFVEEAGITAIFWREGRLAYAVIGRADRDRITAIASAAYRQLNP